MDFTKLDIAILIAALKLLINESEGDSDEVLTQTIPDEKLYEAVEQYEKLISEYDDDTQIKSLCANFQKILVKLEAKYVEASE